MTEASARDPVAPGAGMVAASAVVYEDASLVGAGVAVLPAMSECEILETVPGAVRIAYYDPETLLRQTGYLADDGILIGLRRHLTPGPYYQNIHPDADILSEPRADAILLGRLPEGVDVEITESTSDWARVVFKGAGGRRQLGWVARPYIVPRREIPEPTPDTLETSAAEASPQPSAAIATATPGVAPTIEPDESPAPGLTESSVTTVTHTVTLNAPDPDKPTRMTSRPDRYAMSYGDYYNGVVAEYLGYDPAGFVKARVGTTEGYWPVEYVWVDAPRGMVPSAIPSAQVAQMGTRLNMRSHPNTGAEVLATYITDQPLEILAIRDGWTQVRVDGLIGYVASAYVVKMVNRYVDPNTIPVNPPFDGTFSKTAATVVPANPQPAVTPGPQAAPTVSVAATAPRPTEPPEPPPLYALVNPNVGDRLPLLERPSADARVLGQYNKGVIVTIDAVYDAAYVRVHIGVTEGYMAIASLDASNVPKGAPDVYDESLPRVRLKRALDSQSPGLFAAPSVYADRVGSCSPGQTVIVLGVTNAWSHVCAGGRIGYLHSENLE
jgi:SH3-like domain-containing protein